jgi:hypothetical protein
MFRKIWSIAVELKAPIEFLWRTSSPSRGSSSEMIAPGAEPGSGCV